MRYHRLRDLKDVNDFPPGLFIHGQNSLVLGCAVAWLSLVTAGISFDGCYTIIIRVMLAFHCTYDHGENGGAQQQQNHTHQ